MTWTGRTDTNKRVLFADVPISSQGLSREEAELFSRSSLEQIKEMRSKVGRDDWRAIGETVDGVNIKYRIAMKETAV